jgi:hypothetical protein
MNPSQLNHFQIYQQEKLRQSRRTLRQQKLDPAAAAGLPATVTAQIGSKYQYMGLGLGFRVWHDVSEML